MFKKSINKYLAKEERVCILMCKIYYSYNIINILRYEYILNKVNPKEKISWKKIKQLDARRMRLLKNIQNIIQKT
jgi:hypothetical protein